MCHIGRSDLRLRPSRHCNDAFFGPWEQNYDKPRVHLRPTHHLIWTVISKVPEVVTRGRGWKWVALWMWVNIQVLCTARAIESTCLIWNLRRRDVRTIRSRAHNFLGWIGGESERRRGKKIPIHGLLSRTFVHTLQCDVKPAHARAAPGVSTAWGSVEAMMQIRNVLAAAWKRGLVWK